jgi:G3E family GTPase
VLLVKTRIAIIGGFLGAGKTTLATRIASRLNNLDKSVAIITNDQGEALVDTQYSKSLGFEVSEVLRGCFCCRFPDFLRSARTLVSSSRPDTILAEPVGSCTDLLATVVAPLKAIYPDEFEVAPLTVVVDPTRLLSEIIGAKSPGDYLRKHQIEEGEVVVLSKIDMIPEGQIPELVDLIKRINPTASVVPYSSVTGLGLDEIVRNVSSDRVSTNRPIDIDYDIYATAEAELGWYNGSYRCAFEDRTDTYDLALKMLKAISDAYQEEDVAHVKIMLTTESNALKMSMVCQNVNVDGVKGSRYGKGACTLIVNARIFSPPDKLKNVIREAVMATLSEVAPESELMEDSSFSPTRPKPTYEMR